MATSQEVVGVVPTAPASRPFLRHVHDFRAFAILFIVAAHAWRLPNGVVDPGLKSWVDDLRQGLTHDSTIYFVLVSGLLLVHLGIREGTWAWLRKRVVNVGLPFLVVSTVIVVLAHEGDVGALTQRLGRAYLRGDAQFHLWYIPWVMGVFAVSPLLLRLPGRRYSQLTVVAAVVPLFVSRTGTEITVAQYAYLLPVYLIGGWIGMHGDALSDWLRRWGWTVVLVAGVTGVYVVTNGAADRPVLWFDVTESVFYVHRVAVSVLVLEWLRRFSDRDLPLVDVVARHSFAIYFLHLSVWRVVWPRWTDAVVAVSPGLVVPASVLLGPVVLLLTLAVTVTIRRLVGERSRWLIGV